MRPRHCFTIEPMINEGTWRDDLWPDKWTATTADGLRSAQFEHTMIIVEENIKSDGPDHWSESVPSLLAKYQAQESLGSDGSCASHLKKEELASSRRVDANCESDIESKNKLLLSGCSLSPPPICVVTRRRNTESDAIASRLPSLFPPEDIIHFLFYGRPHFVDQLVQMGCDLSSIFIQPSKKASEKNSKSSIL
ncbi:unnamed protein product [Protopolystoma xenopodis]|uniref:Peptidase M24 domain-containing protein n=1 Tax=Protopolystoma xenopodis TaxID=117903 RepID=A0A448WYN4_9PLAT|nr:unnamed protein product [Protopolystoma xenopodis]